MKTLRRIGIIVIVALALAFTACDDILEVIYPEFASDEGVDFGIGVWIQIEVPADQVTGDPLLAGSVERIDPDGHAYVIEESYDFVYPEWIWGDQGNLRLQGFIEFGITDPGEYRVQIWLETNNNQWPDFDEPVFFARWQPYPETDPDFWDDIFRFENGDEMTWKNGEALFGGFERLNYNFKVKNNKDDEQAFVIQASNIGIREYLVETADENRTYVDRTWRLINLARKEEDPPRDVVVDEDYTHYPKGVGSESFSIDYSDADYDGAVDYLLEIELFYMDGGWAFAQVPVRIISQEEDAGKAFDVTVKIHDAEWDPLRLIKGDSYDIFVQVITQGSGVQNGEWVPAQLDTTDGILSIEVEDLSYNPTGTGAPEIDFLFLYIDVTEDLTIAHGDWFLWIPLGLAYGETEVTYEYAGWKLMPVLSDGMIE